MKKNLERLSSGYKINRAGDDAAGLAISEKMRAQITGLETAQKNAKDGISLVQTAEGALTEVHDMLNRMVELATQSANGTYDNSTDRFQLQKEVNQLMDEINRIADSANFNGIQLLDGSMAKISAVAGGDAHAGQTVFMGIDRIISSVIGKNEKASDVAGIKTILDGSGAKATRASFQIDLKTLDFKNEKVYEVKGTETVTVTYSYQTAGGTKLTTTTTVKIGSGVKGQYQVGDSFTVATSVNVNGENKTLTLRVFVGASGALKVTPEDGTLQVTKATSTAKFNAVATVVVKDVVSVTVNGVKMSTGKGGIEIKGANGTVTSQQIASLVAQSIAGNNSVVNINGVDWTCSVAGSVLIFTQIKLPETADEARANFDVSIGVEKGNSGEDFKITLVESNKADGTFSMNASIKPGTYVSKAGIANADAKKANTIFNITKADIMDGTKIAIGTKTITLAVGPNTLYKTGNKASTSGGTGYVEIDEDDDLNTALCKISAAIGSTVNFKILDSKGKEQLVQFQIGVSDSSMGFPTGLAVQRIKEFDSKATQGADSCSFNTLEKLAANFKIRVEDVVSNIEAVKEQRGLTLQIGDTADSYNQLEVSIEDCHTAALGLDSISIADQESAQAAVDVIKNAINYVSDVRGTLGATQNRLDHTINNLSVMTENIQDAESTIRDTDIAEEMMAYTKNNILIQAAQAMLAQANQVPQGVLQLLQ